MVNIQYMDPVGCIISKRKKNVKEDIVPKVEGEKHMKPPPSVMAWRKEKVPEKNQEKY